MPVEGFIIYVYCCVDDICRGIVSQPLRSRGFMPKLGDSEAITMEIVGEFMGKGQDKGIWRYFRNHWHGWFPNLGSRANFAKQCANLWGLKRRIQDHLAWQTGAMGDTAHLVDGFPMP
ncbi:MAG: IS982 family transposase, partial [Methylobacter sp.]